jgi:iron(III) transport system permease protein
VEINPKPYFLRSVSALFSFNIWTAARALSFLAVSLPLLTLLAGLFSAPSRYWIYVSRHLLKSYLTETFLLTFGASGCAFVLGVALAWVVSFYDFAGKAFFKVALVLPLAIPPFMAAYAYDGLLGYTGLIQTFFRNNYALNLNSYLAAIPAQLWAIFVFTVTLFPYVYILTSSFLRHQSASIYENALLLGGGSRRLFFKVFLPLLWPSASAGAILVGLEALNDFGVSSFFGLTTFTTAIFAAWFGMGDSNTAVKLALILLAIVLFILLGRKAIFNFRRYQIVSTREKPLTPKKAGGFRQTAIVFLCLAALFAGFIAPVFQLFYWLKLSWAGAFTEDLAAALSFTLKVSFGATLVIMAAATATVNANRLFRTRFSNFLSQGATLGYSIPSAVLAIGVISFFLWSDKALAPLTALISDRPLNQSIIVLVFAFFLRFFTIGYQAIESGFAKIPITYFEASRTLGRGIIGTFLRIDLPMVRLALLSGATLVFIDTLKELPLSLMLRPFNTETLGTSVYHFSKNEVLEQTALPSLCVIMAGTVFIVLWNFFEKKGAKHVSGN